MRESLTVSGTAALMTSTSASAIAPSSTISTEPLAPWATTCWRSISCERAIPERPSTSATSYGASASSRLKASEAPTPPPPPTMAIRRFIYASSLIV